MMSKKDMEQLEKKSIYSLQITNDLKEQAITHHMNELSRVVRSKIKKKNILIVVIENLK